MLLFWHNKNTYAEGRGEMRSAPPPGLPPAGVMLRRRREALGLELAEIGEALKIKPAFIAALEEGQPDRLPGPAYAAGFLRAYGEYLGFDGAEVLRRFEIEAGGLDSKPDLSFPLALGERGVPGRRMLLVAVILGICGYGTWYYLSSRERTQLERVSEVPASLLRPNAAGAPEAAPPRAAAEPAGAVRSPALPAVPPSSPATASEASPATASEASPAVGTADAAPPSTSASAGEMVRAAAPEASEKATTKEPAPSAKPVSPAGTGAVADGSTADGTRGSPGPIVIRATADSWIQVRDADNGVLVSRVLKPGDSYSVPDRPGLSLWTGNAGGLSITIAGKPAPGIGPMGAVRRDVALEPGALMAGAAVRR